MLSRRSIFSLFAGLAAVAAGAKVQASPVHEGRMVWVPSSDPTPRASHYAGPGTITDPTHSHGRTWPRMELPSNPSFPEYPLGKTLGRWISNGDHFVLIKSPEGQAVLNSIAAPHAGMSRW